MLKTSTNFLKKDLNSPNVHHNRSPRLKLNSNDLDKNSSKFGVVVKSLDKQKKPIKYSFNKINLETPITHLDDDMVSPKYSRNSIDCWKDNSPAKLGSQDQKLNMNPIHEEPRPKKKGKKFIT